MAANSEARADARAVVDYRASRRSKPRVEEFAMWMLRQRRHARTVKAYGRSIERFAIWLKQHRRGTVKSAKWKDVRDYSETLPWSYASRNALVCALKAYYRFIDRTDSPAWAVVCPKEPRRIAKPLTAAELERVLSAASSLPRKDVKALCVCAYYLGIRREDLARLRWDQFRKDGSLHLVGKGGIERDVPVNALVVEALDQLPRVSEYVFPGRWGGHISGGTVNLWVTQVADISGVNLWPHRFRHTAATNGYKKTKDLFAVQEFLGHAKASTTRGYVRTAWEDVKAVSDAL